MNRHSRLANRQDLALFCGAGISAASPSRLPTWRELADGMITSLAATARAAVPAADATGDAVDAQLPQLIECRLRPDVVVSVLSDVMGDAVLQGFGVLQSTVYNANHALIAALAARGRIRFAFMTNFDCLIEAACVARGVDFRVVATGEEFEADASIQSDVFTLYKLHGSIERPDSLIANINEMTRGLHPAKARTLQRVMAGHHLVFLGYSGNDLTVNSDYLLLEKAHHVARGFTWVLRPGETSPVVAQLAQLYGERADVLHTDLPNLLAELAGEPVPQCDSQETTAAAALSNDWTTSVSAEDACFGLGRLYLHAALWDSAIGAIKVPYRAARDDATGQSLRRYGVAAYYLAHAWERFRAAHMFPTDIVADVFILLEQAERVFTGGDDWLMLARIAHTRGRYWGFAAGSHGEGGLSYGEAALTWYERAGATRDLGELYIEFGDQLESRTVAESEQARGIVERGLELAESVGDLVNMARAASVIGDLLRQQERLAESLDYLTLAIRWLRIVGDRTALQTALWRAGTVRVQLGELEAGRELLSECADLAEALDHHARWMSALNVLALTEERLGIWDAAEGHFEQAAIIAYVRRAALAGGNARSGLARVALHRGDVARARKLAREVVLDAASDTSIDATSARNVLATISSGELRKRSARDQ